MKWTISLLILLGIIASFCVILLVNAFRASSSLRSGQDELSVVLAAGDLPAWKVLTADDVKLEKITKSDAPADSFSNTALVVGKVLSVDMTAGQILTKSRILTTGGPADIAALLEPGMRAVSVTVSSDQISGGLLYPRCFVDVLASFKLSGGYGRNEESKGEALSTTLLERVKVLAIAGESMLTTPDKEEKGTVRSPSQRLSVTLELDSKQAEALQLATNNGSISMALRNPLDTLPVSQEATVLNRGKLSRLGSLLGATVGSSVPAGNGGESAADLPEEAVTDAEWRTNQPSHWGVTVIRGSKVAEEEFTHDKDDAVVAN